MTDPGPESEKGARAAFLAAYESDLAADCIRTLAEYQSRFPGHEASIADEWKWLEPASASGGSTGPRPVAQQTIGPYRILGELGRGAQATVYLAEHESLRRQVALKVLRAPMTDGSSTSEQRFRREAEATASIEHPNICSVYEAGSSDGATWIAMQYVPGSTLAAHLVRSDGTNRESTVHLPGDASSEGGSGTASSGAAKRSNLMRVVAFSEQAARALHVAHERGLVHRDIKPGNLMVTEDGKPVVLDFGLARAANRDGAIDSAIDGAIDGAGLTRTHDVLGTPYYMAPEQLRSDIGVVDRRVDVYALGVTLFECLTRQRPFVGVSVEALYQQILTTEPPGPRTINPHIPRDLEVVLLTAIEKDRVRRYQTALDFAEDLRRVRQYEPIRAKPISTLGRVVRMARRHPGVAASLSLAVVSLVAGLVVSLLVLQDADAMLLQRDKALTNLYDTVSLQAASDNVLGRINRMHAQLRERALVQINRESAGFGDEVAREMAQVSGARPGASLDAFVRLVSRAGDLGSVGQHAVADVLFPVLKAKMGGVLLDRNTERADDAVAMAEQQCKLLEDLPETDDRKIRARILWLDGLNQTGNPARARKLVEKWLLEERRDDGTLPTDAARLALYRSRLGAALLGLEQAEAAYELLATDGVVSHVVRKYPHTWYSNVARASLVEALDETGKPSEAARRALAGSLRNSRVHRTLGHQSVYAIRVALGPHLWDRAVQLYWSSASPEPADVEGFLDELSRRQDTDEAAACFFMFLAPQIAQNLGLSHADFSRPDIGRLVRLAVEHLEALPSCHESIRARAFGFYGKHLEACGRYQQARKWLDQRIGELDVPIEERWVFARELGANLAQLGHYERAEVLLTRALEEGSSWYGPTASPILQARRSLARLYRKWGKLDDAVEWHLNAIDAIAQRKGEDFERRLLGDTYLQFGKLDEAEREFCEVLDRNRKDIGAWSGLAHVSLLRGRFDFDKAMEQAAQARNSGAWTSGEQAGERPRPIALAKNAMRRADGIRAMALFRRGNPGDLHAALGFFESAATGPEQVNGDGFFSDYGAALVASGRGQQARRLLEDLTEKRPEDPLAWHARARFLATTKGLGQEDRLQAVVCAERASEFCNRGRAFVLAMLADAQFYAGDKAAAGATALEVKKLMAGRDAQWLSVERFRQQCAKY